MIILIILALTLIAASVYRLINYGRWASRQGNIRGVVGLYILAGLTVVLPVGVYILNVWVR